MRRSMVPKICAYGCPGKQNTGYTANVVRLGHGVLGGWVETPTSRWTTGPHARRGLGGTGGLRYLLGTLRLEGELHSSCGSCKRGPAKAETSSRRTCRRNITGSGRNPTVCQKNGLAAARGGCGDTHRGVWPTVVAFKPLPASLGLEKGPDLGAGRREPLFDTFRPVWGITVRAHKKIEL